MRVFELRSRDRFVIRFASRKKSGQAPEKSGQVMSPQR